MVHLSCNTIEVGNVAAQAWSLVVCFVVAHAIGLVQWISHLHSEFGQGYKPFAPMSMKHYALPHWQGHCLFANLRPHVAELLVQLNISFLHEELLLHQALDNVHWFACAAMSNMAKASLIQTEANHDTGCCFAFIQLYSFKQCRQQVMRTIRTG